MARYQGLYMELLQVPVETCWVPLQTWCLAAGVVRGHFHLPSPMKKFLQHGGRPPFDNGFPSYGVPRWQIQVSCLAKHMNGVHGDHVGRRELAQDQ